MKKLGFGFMRLPLTDENDQSSINIQQTIQMTDAFMEKGFTYFDTAYVYHDMVSESALKQALVDRYPRDSFVIADKMPLWTVSCTEDYQTYFDEQLQRLGVEYIDYYLLHSLGMGTYKKSCRLGGFEFMAQKKAEGKVKNIGFSFHDSAEVLDLILTERPEVDFVQLQINYLDWDNFRVESRMCYEVARKHNKPVIVMEPVKGGGLANVPEEAEKLFRSYHPDLSPASWAVRFAASLDGVIVVLSGMSNMEQVSDNVSYMENFEPLNSDEKIVISKVKDIIQSKSAIACTACNYCLETCPSKIPIPKYFALFNELNAYGESINVSAQYTLLNRSFGKASDCIECKKCEELCPQHLAISDHMKDVSEAFD